MTTLKIECDGIDEIQTEIVCGDVKIIQHISGVNIEELMQEIIRTRGCETLLDCIGDDEIRAYLGGCDE